MSDKGVPYGTQYQVDSPTNSPEVSVLVEKVLAEFDKARDGGNSVFEKAMAEVYKAKGDGGNHSAESSGVRKFSSQTVDIHGNYRSGSSDDQDNNEEVDLAQITEPIPDTEGECFQAPIFNRVTSSLPNLSPWRGKHGFCVEFAHSQKNWVIIPRDDGSRGVVFIKRRIPWEFAVVLNEPIDGMCIRLTPVFDDSEFAMNLVICCQQSEHATAGNNYFETQSLLRIVDTGALYEYHRDRLTVRFLVSDVTRNDDGSYANVKLFFTCLGTCPIVENELGKRVNRTFSVIFTLENNDGGILGRDCVRFRVCTNPARDSKKLKQGLAVETDSEECSQGIVMIMMPESAAVVQKLLASRNSNASMV
ncbi:unnamed protein product [Notodromas monacha]|uniref:p53 DNA-binding domain-containing protein n=1 Tax=Notodromas monacha TaxID=399045 RepID=A0A7R9GIA4_9CRUS|nr:unnamed protein product [Notodromas monacha]CAG0921574.1 unnamed protein product [Notodromas monacha]